MITQILISWGVWLFSDLHLNFLKSAHESSLQYAIKLTFPRNVQRPLSFTAELFFV